MVQLAQLVTGFEELWPLSNAEEWDTPGLQAGAPNQNVQRVMLSVDVTDAVVACAIQAKSDLLLAHHPYLMRGVKFLAEDQPKGSVLAKAIRANLAIYSAHTNADVVADGVSDVLAKQLGLSDSAPLLGQGDVGTGRVGDLTDATTLGKFAATVARTLPHTATGVRVSGDYNHVVERVAVCGGAGDSFIEAARAAGADVYVTSDLRHHVVQDARESSLLASEGNQMAIIDVSHWASEFLWLEVAAEQLRRIYPEVSFEVCDLRTDPWDFVVTQ
ncbi:MAG: Nif3-like dinuclear metal center hexameric protein [Actinomycetales bacterium]|nr:Nif3-like dinuclear metal center hexameric protein [Actinomycetales bacterium]